MLAHDPFDQRLEIRGLGFDHDAPREPGAREIEHVLDQPAHVLAARDDSRSRFLSGLIDGATMEELRRGENRAQRIT